MGKKGTGWKDALKKQVVSIDAESTHRTAPTDRLSNISGKHKLDVTQKNVTPPSPLRSLRHLTTSDENHPPKKSLNEDTSQPEWKEALRSRVVSVHQKETPRTSAASRLQKVKESLHSEGEESLFFSSTGSHSQSGGGNRIRKRQEQRGQLFSPEQLRFEKTFRMEVEEKTNSRLVSCGANLLNLGLKRLESRDLVGFLWRWHSNSRRHVLEKSVVIQQVSIPSRFNPQFIEPPRLT